MSRDNYISDFQVNQQKIIDYIFQNISKNEEYLMEEFLDNNEELAATIEDLLDFCLEQQFNHFMVRHFAKTQACEPLNDILNDIDFHLEEIEIEKKKLEIVPTDIPSKNPQFKKFLALGTRVFGKRITKTLFTFLLVLNFWQTGGDYSNSNLLKASQKEEVKQMMILNAYQIRYMRVDMLDDRPITDFISDVAVPSNFEIYYFTKD